MHQVCGPALQSKLWAYCEPGQSSQLGPSGLGKGKSFFSPHRHIGPPCLALPSVHHRKIRVTPLLPLLRRCRPRGCQTTRWTLGGGSSTRFHIRWSRSTRRRRKRRRRIKARKLMWCSVLTAVKYKILVVNTYIKP